ncbi:RNA polymerase II subunit 5-mediating protein homolog [Gigantopelta aegis]|uniref:RNA polymerase II subunit 5-mediating protein homolog n=1 Tax=Gigantopelta aegis TaxID=1735272 RepID=UPI001B88D90A|nr:RNA polymerase II subunit 5-mediating protein homolog [Gigantopelta aegis]XP_041358672.1 RNA polymerase II subunit 5-mediating protein homolog [Gigantopelta aegis]
MDWERDVNSIVRETEENLIKIREKINGKSTLQESDKYNVHTYLSPWERSFSKDYMPERRLNNHTQTVSPTILVDPGYLGSAHPDTVHLQEKLETQNKTIEHLNELVKYLECEREQFIGQIEELTAAVKELKRSSVEKQSSFQMNEQISGMKREVAREMEILKNQLIMFKANSLHLPHSGTTSHGVSREVRDIHCILQEELHFLRRDLDFLKSRIGSLENNVLSFSGQHTRSPDTFLKDCDRERHRRRVVQTLTTLPLADKSPRKTDLQELRCAVFAFKDKLDLVEGKVNKILPQSSVTNGNGYSEQHSESHQYSKSTKHMMDDLDSTDDDDDDDDVDDDDDIDCTNVDDVDIDDDSDSDVLDSEELVEYSKVSVSDMNSKAKDEISDSDSLNLDDLDLDANEHDECDSRLSETDEEDIFPEK